MVRPGIRRRRSVILADQRNDISMYPPQDRPLANVILAPLSGELVPLALVPDPVFAQKMVGDGVAIDPLDNLLVSPCDGEILQLHPAGHAVTVRTLTGIEVLMHIGLDTVNLKGQGFVPKVKKGDQVSTGTPLIEFDLDYVATHATSALTLLVITTMESVVSLQPATGMVTAGQHPAFTFFTKAAVTPESEVGGERVVSEAILIPNPTGLHARPSAVLARIAKTFRSEVRLYLGGRHANAKSVTSLLSLDVRQGAKVVVVAQGADAREAVAKLAVLLRQGLGDEGCQPVPTLASTTPDGAAVVAPRPRSEDPNLLLGAAASPGLAVGSVWQIHHEEMAVVEDAARPDEERQRLHDAIEKAKGQLAALQAQLQTGHDSAKAAIFAAHTELLDDPELLDVAISFLAKGKSAAFAWRAAFRTHAETLAAMPNALLAQRAGDLRDVGERVLALLTGVERKKAVYPPRSILVAEDLTPSDTASLDREKVVGFCTTRGGATSHVAILARSLGIPALAGIEPRALEIATGTPVILDGGRGLLRLNPSPAETEHISRQQQAAEEKRKQDLTHAPAPAVTVDGHRIEVVANIGGLADARQIEKLGGEGVGLLRSEFLFMERATAPSEEEQFEAYRDIAQALGPDRPLIIRTLDVGGDKPLAYLPIPAEDNPFMGERGIRVGLERPEVLRTQLRAILRASVFGKVQVMFPMISTITELRDAKAILGDEAASLNIAPVPTGIMVEVPATAVMAAQFAREADFFSVGTNDLTQYTLAMDRGHPKLSPQVDGLNPAVLRLIEQSVTGAHSRGKWVGVCGGIAGDAHAVPLLVGLGVDELSVSLPAIPAVKAQIRSLRLSTCRQLAQEALGCDTAAEVRALVAKQMSHPDSASL